VEGQRTTADKGGIDWSQHRRTSLDNDASIEKARGGIHWTQASKGTSKAVWKDPLAVRTYANHPFIGLHPFIEDISFHPRGHAHPGYITRSWTLSSAYAYPQKAATFRQSQLVHDTNMSTQGTEQRTIDSINQSIREGRREKRKEIARKLATTFTDLSSLMIDDTATVHQQELERWLHNPTAFNTGRRVLARLSEAMEAIRETPGDSRVELEDPLLSLCDTLEQLKDDEPDETFWRK